MDIKTYIGFTSLQTYKVLKLSLQSIDSGRVLLLYKLTRFSNLQFGMYFTILVLLLYKLTRFSNFILIQQASKNVLLLYKLTRFSNLKFNEGSRRTIHIGMRCKLFCTGN